LGLCNGEGGDLIIAAHPQEAFSMCFSSSLARAVRHFFLLGLVTFALTLSAYEGAHAQNAQGRVVQPASQSSRQNIEKLVAPVALYPDALLAQVLTAAAYPGDIVRAARWLSRNADAVARQDFSEGDAQNWDPSVKALLRFPTVIDKMNADLDWTTELGEVFVNQPEDVAASVQALRDQAASAGVLQTNAQHRIRRMRDLDRDVIIIESVEPDVIYVPIYDPLLVYRPSPSFAQVALVTFGSAVVIRSLIKSRDPWNWRTGAVYRPYWPGYRITRPEAVTAQPWRPDPRRFRSATVPRPAMTTPSVQRSFAARPVSRYERVQRSGVTRGAYVRAPAPTRSAVSRPSASRSYASRPAVRSTYATRPPAVRVPAQPAKPKKKTTYPYSR
jgi:hypothetical protein